MTLREVAISCRPHVVGLQEIDEYMFDNAALLNQIAAAHKRADWGAYVFAHTPQWQFDGLLGAVQNGLDGPAYWGLLTDLWTMRGPGLNEDLWLRLYTRDVPPGRRAAMNTAELAVFDDLPATVKLYRGARAEQMRGLSWTLERKVAAFFAERVGGVVHTVQLPREALLVYYDRRKESEALVDLDALSEYRIDVAA